MLTRYIKKSQSQMRLTLFLLLIDYLNSIGSDKNLPALPTNFVAKTSSNSAALSYSLPSVSFCSCQTATFLENRIYSTSAADTTSTIVSLLPFTLLNATINSLLPSLLSLSYCSSSHLIATKSNLLSPSYSLLIIASASSALTIAVIAIQSDLSSNPC